MQNAKCLDSQSLTPEPLIRISRSRNPSLTKHIVIPNPQAGDHSDQIIHLLICIVDNIIMCSPGFFFTSGDDSSIVVTIRGGPEQELSSSWLQIVSVTPRAQGIYYCIGSNNEGTAQTWASVSVYKRQALTEQSGA